MKKSRVFFIALLILIIVIAVLFLAFRGNSIKDLTKWAQNLKVEDITSAVSKAGYSASESFQLSDDEIQEVVSLINSLHERDFYLNEDRHNYGPPKFSLLLTTNGGEYYIRQSTWPMFELEIAFEGKLWWFNSDELVTLILEITGWIPEVIWSGKVSGSNIGAYTGSGDDVASNGSLIPAEPITIKVLTGNADNITSISVDHTDGRKVQLDNTGLHEVITVLDSMEKVESLLPFRFYEFTEGVRPEGDKYTITIEYEDSPTDIIYFEKEIMYSHPVLGVYARAYGLRFSIDTNSELYSILEEVLNE